MKARLYARVSTDEQAKKDSSIPAQLFSLKEYCDKEGIQIVGEYIDNGISAATIQKRKELVRLMKEVRSGETILFTKLDRFSRNILDANILVKELNQKGVSIRAILENGEIDTTSADGKFMFDLQVSLAERERKVIGERIKVSFAHKWSKKQPTAPVPFGYTVKDKVAVIEPEKAEIVRDIFKTFISTRSRKQTMETINSRYGLKRCLSFYDKTLRKIEYTGKGYGYDDFFPVIIDKPTFQKVQNMKGQTYGKRGRSFLFSGLLYCECGCRMVSAGAKKPYQDTTKFYKAYRCPAKDYARSCTHTISEIKLEKLVLSEFDSHMQEVVRLKPKEKTRDPKRIQLKMERLKNLYIEGIIDKKEFDKKYNVLEIEYLEEIKEPNQEAVSQWKTVREHYSELTDKEKKRFWNSLIDRVILRFDNTVEIRLL